MRQLIMEAVDIVDDAPGRPAGVGEDRVVPGEADAAFLTQNLVNDGPALTYTIQDVLLLMRAPGFYLDIFVGALIVGAAILNQLTRRGARS